MGRVETRDALFKLVFEYCITHEKNEFSLNQTVEEGQLEEDYLKRCYNGIIEHFDELSQKIDSNAKGYNLERIYKVDLALMLVSAYEILYEKDIPVAVSINEALNLAKKYSTEKSASFINGILSNLVKNEE